MSSSDSLVDEVAKSPINDQIFKANTKPEKANPEKETWRTGKKKSKKIQQNHLI